MASMSSSYSPCLTLPDGMDPVDLVETVYDLIKDIKDPEKPETLEQLNVVHEDLVTVSPLNSDTCLIEIQFIPTVPHCSLATLIALDTDPKDLSFQFEGAPLKVKIGDKSELLPCTSYPRHRRRIDIHIKQGTHDSAKEINKQINDKERVAAALENPSLLKLVNECIKDSDR